MNYFPKSKEGGTGRIFQFTINPHLSHCCADNIHFLNILQRSSVCESFCHIREVIAIVCDIRRKKVEKNDEDFLNRNLFFLFLYDLAFSYLSKTWP